MMATLKLKERNLKVIIINNETAEMEIKELFSFDTNALPVIDGFKEELKFHVDNGNVFDEDVEDVKSFLSHKISKDDKIAILNEIKFEYEYRCHRADDDFSIFDIEVIESAVKSWVGSNFYFSIDEIC